MSAITEIDSSEQIAAAVELLKQMYPQQSHEQILQSTKQMMQEGWKLIGIFDGERCDAVVMYYVGQRLFCGKYLQPESLFVRPEARDKGHTKKLFDWMEQKAEELGCDRLFLHSFVESDNAHKFFYKQGYHIRGFVFSQMLTDKYPS
jgi:N-acetylglutamate synthase and related acetyltransferases